MTAVRAHGPGGRSGAGGHRLRGPAITTAHAPAAAAVHVATACEARP